MAEDVAQQPVEPAQPNLDVLPSLCPVLLLEVGLAAAAVAQVVQDLQVGGAPSAVINSVVREAGVYRPPR